MEYIKEFDTAEQANAFMTDANRDMYRFCERVSATRGKYVFKLRENRKV